MKTPGKKPLYIDDSYMKEWDSVVVSSKRKDADSQFIVLENTAFYPQSGGQSWDEGTITRKSDGKEYRVVFVGKFGESISHEVRVPEGEDLREGGAVHCSLDWERRYQLMKSHTAAHIISEIINRETGAMISGNQLDAGRCRIDFSVEKFDREKLASYEKLANEVISRELDITYEFKSRDEVLKVPAMTKLAKGIDALPKDVRELRLVRIGDFDVQADGGTHVRNTKEIGQIRFTDFSNKGKNNRRIYFTVLAG